MKFTQKLDVLLAQNNLTRGKLAKETGIPYTTIMGFYTKGHQNIRLSNVKRISDFFGVSLDILCDDGRELFEAAESEVSDEFFKKYTGLSEKGKKLVDGMVEGLLDIEAPEERPAAKIEYIREYVTPAAAGFASPAEGEDYVLVPRGKDVPQAADFAVRIAGDSMEPYIKDGSRVYVSRQNEMRDGDVGIFFVDGDMKCKQYCEDSFGNIYLFSLNRRRSEYDVEVKASGGLTVFCFGKVLLGQKIALPDDFGA